MFKINPLNAELNLVCHLLALLGARPILHISRIRVKRDFLRFSLTHRLYPQNIHSVIYWYFYSFPFNIPYKIKYYFCSREFLDLICVSMEVAGIIIIINNFLFKHLAWNFIKNFPVPMMVVVDIVIIIIEVLSTLSYIYIYIYTYIIH